MLKIKNLRGQCQQCGGAIEFHAEAAGTTAECPHCGQPTELFLGPPPQETSPLRKRAVGFMVIAALILGVGLVGSSLALKRARRLAAGRESARTPAEVQPPAAPAVPFAAQGFGVSPVTLDQGQGSSRVHAVGTIQNLSDRPRFGVKVELALLDAAGNQLGVATDYQNVLEPKAEWKFRALVVEKGVVAAKITSLKESP
jgi:hypothetical protein